MPGSPTCALEALYRDVSYVVQRTSSFVGGPILRVTGTFWLRTAA